MATILTQVLINDGQQWEVVWPAMGNADTGVPATLYQYPDKTLTVSGTFGGATVTIQGSADGANWTTLNDFLGNPLVYTAAAIALIAQNPNYVRAITSGGTGTAVNVYILGSKF